MINKSLRDKIILLFTFYFFTNSLFSQIAKENLKYFILDDVKTTNVDIKFVNQIKEFYIIRNYNSVWLKNTMLRNELLYLLQSVSYKGLNKKDYQYNFVELYSKGAIKLHNQTDSIIAELKFTDAAIHYYNDIIYGNTKPSLQYDGITNNLAITNIPNLLNEVIEKNNLDYLTDLTKNTFPEIFLIQNKIKSFCKTIEYSEFKEVVVTSKNATIDNTLLIKKLNQLGIIDTLTQKINNIILKDKIKEAQELFNLISDGVVRSTLLQELNVPLSVRLQQLNIAINYYRWLQCFCNKQSAVVVNIPAAYLKIYQSAKVVMEMKVIVGKKSTPTPTLSSTITEVVLYPYWHVPYSIATKELLPSIKANASFIDKGNYQVLNKNGEIVDPYSINWHALSKNYFPYIIRQSTGCDNALGLLKLNFYNPFGVYLHDTPNKLLFSMNKRYFSHGCMRMEKPMDIGHFILKGNTVAIDTLDQKKCLINQSPIIVTATEKNAVIVWYNLVGINTASNLVFYEDVYEKFKEQKAN